MTRIILLTTILLPVSLHAQTLDDAVRGFLGYVNQVIPILLALILLAFFWSAATFVKNTGDGKEVEEAKKRLWWGIIALFVAVAFWGIVQFFTSDIFGENPDFGAPTIDTGKINELFPDGPPSRNDSQNNN